MNKIKSIRKAVAAFSLLFLAVSFSLSQTIPGPQALSQMDDASMGTLIESLLGGTVSSASTAEIENAVNQIFMIAANSGDTAIIERVASTVAFNLIRGSVPSAVASNAVINAVVSGVSASGSAPSAEIIQATSDGFNAGLNRAALAMGLSNKDRDDLINEASASVEAAIQNNPLLNGISTDIISVPDNVSYDGN